MDIHHVVKSVCSPVLMGIFDICEVRCWTGRPSGQSPVYFTPKVLGWSQASEVHQQQTLSCFHGSCFVHWCIVLLEQEVDNPKLFPQSEGVWNCPTSLCMLKHSEFLLLELKSKAQLVRNNPTFGTMQSEKNRRQMQTFPSDCQMEKHVFSLQRTCLRVVWHALYLTDIQFGF